MTAKINIIREHHPNWDQINVRNMFGLDPEFKVEGNSTLIEYKLIIGIHFGL